MSIQEVREKLEKFKEEVRISHEELISFNRENEIIYRFIIEFLNKIKEVKKNEIIHREKTRKFYERIKNENN